MGMAHKGRTTYLDTSSKFRGEGQTSPRVDLMGNRDTFVFQAFGRY